MADERLAVVGVFNAVHEAGPHLQLPPLHQPLHPHPIFRIPPQVVLCEDRGFDVVAIVGVLFHQFQGPALNRRASLQALGMRSHPEQVAVSAQGDEHGQGAINLRHVFAPSPLSL
jgi:hypothetical protein